MLNELKKLLRPLRAMSIRHNRGSIDLNTTQTAESLRKFHSRRRSKRQRTTSLELKSNCSSSSVSSSGSYDYPEDIRIATHVYENAEVGSPVRTVFESVNDTPRVPPFMVSGVCTDCTFEVSRDDDFQQILSDISVPSKTILYDQESTSSFAVEDVTVLQTEAPDDEAPENFAKVAQQSLARYFKQSMGFAEKSVNSSAEAYNEYIRLKHTRKVIENLMEFYGSQDVEGDDSLVHVYFGQLHEFINRSMDSLEKRFPHLYSYSKRRQTKKVKETTDHMRLTEADDVAEYSLM